MQYYVGWSIIGVSVLNVLVNIGIMIFTSVR